MSRWYLDTSAALKLLVDEEESDALAALIVSEQPDLVACYLLETELRRQADLHGVEQAEATALLHAVSLYEVPPSLFREAGLLHGERLRSLDALHLAAAVNIGVDHVLTYDRRMGEAARTLGLPVLAPGAK